jgi:hypothetical protein
MGFPAASFFKKTNSIIWGVAFSWISYFLSDAGDWLLIIIFIINNNKINKNYE